MPYLSTTLGEARKLVAAGEISADSIIGMEGWPGDAKLEIFVPSKAAAPAATDPVPPVPPVPPVAPPVVSEPPAVVSQEEGSDEPASPTDPAAEPGN